MPSVAYSKLTPPDATKRQRLSRHSNSVTDAKDLAALAAEFDQQQQQLQPPKRFNAAQRARFDEFLKAHPVGLFTPFDLSWIAMLIEVLTEAEDLQIQISKCSAADAKKKSELREALRNCVRTANQLQWALSRYPTFRANARMKERYGEHAAQNIRDRASYTAEHSALHKATEQQRSLLAGVKDGVIEGSVDDGDDVDDDDTVDPVPEPVPSRKGRAARIDPSSAASDLEAAFGRMGPRGNSSPSYE